MRFMSFVRQIILMVLLKPIVFSSEAVSSATQHPLKGKLQKRLYRHVVRLTSTDKPRNYRNLASLNQAADYIKKQFQKLRLETSEQKYLVSGKEYRNIIGRLNKKGSNSLIVAGAHYDVCGDQPGADDNASGIAGLIEVARLTVKNQDKITDNIEFVAYSLEEPPFFRSIHMGSWQHAEMLKKKNVTVKYMICLEMIGYFSEQSNSQRFPLAILGWFFPEKGNFIAVVGNFNSSEIVKRVKKSILKNTDISCESLVSPKFLAGMDFSDHRSYWKHNYKAIMITDTSFYRNTNYHTPKDSSETLDYPKMAEVVKGIAPMLYNSQ